MNIFDGAGNVIGTTEVPDNNSGEQNGANQTITVTDTVTGKEFTVTMVNGSLTTTQID